MPMYIQTEVENCVETNSSHFKTLKEVGKNENIIFNSLCKRCYFPKHSDSLSLKFSFQGKEQYNYGKTNVSVNSGSFLALNEGQEHSSWVDSETWVQSFAIYLTPEFVDENVRHFITEEDKILDDLGPANRDNKLDFFQTLLPFNQRFYRRVQDFKKILEYTEGKDQFWIDENLRLLLGGFIDEYRKHVLDKVKDVEAVKLSTRVEILKRVNIAKDFIESYFTEDITLKDISNVSFLSENMLLRHFKKVFNTTPYNYITQKRLDLAKELLITSNIPVNKITVATGFQSPSSFGRVFKVNYGVTPESFRKEILENAF
jgi:AraC family transcriptional regulator